MLHKTGFFLGKRVWSFFDLEQMGQDELDEILGENPDDDDNYLAEIPSDGESIAGDFLSGNEDDLEELPNESQTQTTPVAEAEAELEAIQN